MLLRNVRKGGRDHDFLVEFGNLSTVVPITAPDAAGGPGPGQALLSLQLNGLCCRRAGPWRLQPVLLASLLGQQGWWKPVIEEPVPPSDEAQQVPASEQTTLLTAADTC